MCSSDLTHQAHIHALEQEGPEALARAGRTLRSRGALPVGTSGGGAGAGARPAGAYRLDPGGPAGSNWSPPAATAGGGRRAGRRSRSTHELFCEKDKGICSNNETNLIIPANDCAAVTAVANLAADL